MSQDGQPNKDVHLTVRVPAEVAAHYSAFDNRSEEIRKALTAYMHVAARADE